MLMTPVQERLKEVLPKETYGRRVILRLPLIERVLDIP